MLTSMNIKVSGKVPVDVEELTDRWSVYVHGFSFYAYGRTRSEAREAAHAGVRSLLESRKGNLENFIAVIDASGLDLTLEVSPEVSSSETANLPIMAGSEREHMAFNDSWGPPVHA